LQQLPFPFAVGAVSGLAKRPRSGLALTQCHLAYLPTMALTCMFAPDRQLGRSGNLEPICAGQSDKEGQLILEDQLMLSGILRPVRGKESLLWEATDWMCLLHAR
jgi:hypothetical protein